MKKLLATCLVFALLLPLSAGCQSVLAAQENTTQATISREEALNIALADAGLTEKDIYDLDLELDRDRGIWHYDVDFERNGRDYDYEIHAVTGEILHKKIPAPTVTPQPEPEVPTPEPPVPVQPVTPPERITRAEAVNTALAHAGLTTDVVYDLDAEPDNKHGIWVYEVDFEADGYEYEYEIHAVTGEILRSQKQWD